MRTLFRAKGVFDPLGKSLKEFVVEDGKFSSSMAKIDKEIFLDGYVYPGFIDAHAHLIGTGVQSLTQSLSGVKNFNEFLEIVSQAQADVLRGWDDEILGRYPTKEELDIVKKPMLVVRKCGHVGVANTLFLEKVGISSESGVLKEGKLAEALLKTGKNLESVKKAVKAGERVFFSYGVTSVHSDDMSTLPEDVVKMALRDATISVYEHYHVHSVEEIKEIVRYGKATSVKVLLDGSLGARTAYLREPYSDLKGTKGELNFSPYEVKEIVRIANENGIQVAMHVIGDGALDVALEAFENGNSELRHRLIHVQVSHADQIEKIKRLKLYVDAQPQFYVSDLQMAKERLGERMKDAYKFREMMQADIPVAFSSDSPVEIPNPLGGIQAAKMLGISVEESLKAYTVQGAYQEFSEREKGRFSDGMRADFVVLNRCLENSDAVLLATYKSGQLVWKKEE